MNHYHRYLTLGVLCASLLAAGCASRDVSLHEVRDFADASAKLGGYAELSARYRDTYLREQPYLTPAADKIARENQAKRRALYDDFVSVQKSVVLYMQTLARLAGDERFDLTPQLDDLGKGLKANAENGLEQRHLSAYIGLSRLLARTAASGYQKRSVESMVRDGDADVQTLIEAMISLTHLHYKTNENEKKMVLGMFETELPYSRRPNDRLLATLAKAHRQSKSDEYKLVTKRYALALQGLAKVSLGHQKLHENLNNLSAAEVRQTLADLGRDLRMLREGLGNNGN